jgi:hypothetical protein
MATYIYSPPNKESLSANPTASQKGVKYRIYNIFKPTIVLDELSLVSDGPTPDNRKIQDSAGLQYPLVKINNYFISEMEIDFLSIDCRDFLPRITLQVTFLKNKFVDKEMPKDGDFISIAIRNKSDDLNMIRNDYVITGVTASKRRTSGPSPVTVTFFGELFVPGLRGKYTDAFKGTSMDVLKEIAQRLHLGFNANDEDSDDKQLWYLFDSYDKFIEDTVIKSWRNDNSFYDVWIDIYYNLNFVNIQKQLLSAEDDVDEAAVLNNVDSDWTWGAETEQNKTKELPKVFSNYLGYRTSSFFITNWKPVNRSSAVTMKYGTSMQSGFFEHQNSLYEDPNSQKYWSLDVPPAYDKEKLNSYILLRGRATYDPSINNGELARANYDFQSLYKQNIWMGIQYTIANPDDDNLKWTGNHHRNYLRAQIQNCINLVELDKLNLEIDVQGTNMNIIRGDKLPVIIIGNDPIENMDVDSRAETRNRKNEFYSGWYMVKGFTLSWSKRDEDSIISNFSQTFVLTRREWPAPIPVDPVPVNANNVTQ